MDSVQAVKAVFVKENFASPGFEPRTLFYPWSCATNTLLAKIDPLMRAEAQPGSPYHDYITVKRSQCLWFVYG